MTVWHIIAPPGSAGIHVRKTALLKIPTDFLTFFFWNQYCKTIKTDNLEPLFEIKRLFT